MSSRATRGTQEAARRRQEDEAMAAATLQKEKDAAKNDGLKAANEGNPNVAVDTNSPHVPLPTVVSPLSAPNLTSLLTGHIGQEVGTQAADNVIAMDMGINTQDDKQVNDNVKSPKKKKSKKVKSTKEDKSMKRDRSGSSLKKSSFPTQAVAATSSTKDYKFEWVFYKAGLELKGEDKYSAYVKHIGNLLENIQLVDPLAIMHAIDESGGTKPLGFKSEMSTDMTVFLAYALVRRNAKAFQPKKNNDRRKGRKGKDEPDTLDPSVYPTVVFPSDVEPEIIISHVAHEFGRTGGFYFRKKQPQCKETMTPFIIYFLYIFNEIATLRGELTFLLKEALQGMKDDLMLPDEFEYLPLPDINIFRGLMRETLDDSDGQLAVRVKELFTIFYVNDGYIASRDAEFLQEALNILVVTFKRTGLAMNTKKTQAMVCTPGKIRVQLPTDSYNHLREGVAAGEESKPRLCITVFSNINFTP